MAKRILKKSYIDAIFIIFYLYIFWKFIRSERLPDSIEAFNLPEFTISCQKINSAYPSKYFTNELNHIEIFDSFIKNLETIVRIVRRQIPLQRQGSSTNLGMVSSGKEFTNIRRGAKGESILLYFISSVYQINYVYTYYFSDCRLRHCFFLALRMNKVII